MGIARVGGGNAMQEALMSHASAGGGGALSQAAIEERRKKAQQVRYHTLNPTFYYPYHLPFTTPTTYLFYYSNLEPVTISAATLAPAS